MQEGRKAAKVEGKAEKKPIVKLKDQKNDFRGCCNCGNCSNRNEKPQNLKPCGA